MKELRSKQLELYKILCEIKNVLYSENINFFLIGGSVLGSIRHKGFIPWDDDIDIGVYRKDFQKLEEVLEKQKNSMYIYSKSDKGLYEDVPYGRIYLKKEFDCKIITRNIDVYPIDGVPNNYFLLLLQAIFIRVYHLSVIKKVAKNRGKIAHFFTKLVLRIFPNRLLDFFRFFSKKIVLFWQLKKTKNISNIFGYKGFKDEIMPREYIGNPVLSKFETEYFYIPEKWNEYLTHLYGNYMEFPPKNERKPKHNTIIKLED